MALYSAHVDARIGPLARELGSGHGIQRWSSDGLGKIISGPAGEQRQTAIGPGLEDRVGDIAPGPVASDSDQCGRARIDRAPRQFGFFAGPRGDIELWNTVSSEGLAREGENARPASPAGGRVDDDANPWAHRPTKAARRCRG